MFNFYCVGNKYGCLDFTEGSNGKIVSVDEALDSDSSVPLCWAGSYKELLYHHCLEKKRTFFNLDTGYFGNIKRKEIIRVSINNFQNSNPIVNRPSDRWDRLNISVTSLSRGSSIVVVPPDLKKLNTLRQGTEEEWINETVSNIKKYTDRPIRIRYRPGSRRDRMTTYTFFDYITDNTWCVVGHSSNALVEAAMADIPVISLGHSAVKSLYNYKMEDIEQIKVADKNLKQSWLNHLSYCQFTLEELRSGMAWELLSA